MLNFLNVFEKVIVYSLAGLLALAILSSTANLGVTLIKNIYDSNFLLQGSDLLEVFGLFLLVLLGIELLETMRAYMREHVVHVEVVMVVAIIAIARKVIILDIKELNGLTLLGLAALLASLAFGYVHIKRTHLNCNK